MEPCGLSGRLIHSGQCFRVYTVMKHEFYSLLLYTSDDDDDGGGGGGGACLDLNPTLSDPGLKNK